MLGYIAKRLAQAILILIGITMITYILVYLVPADPVRQIAGRSATAETVESIRRQLGLDLPLWQQYLRYLGNLLQGDLGRSYIQKTEVTTLILSRLPATLLLLAGAIVVELLNSKVDHKDYQGDRSAFGLEVVKRVGSPRVKLLYDIYHMQIMEGDLIRTIRQHHQHIAHYHTGGVPGRHELDDSQELQWAAICRAIADTGFQGYLAHEFVPTRDPLRSLREAVVLCDV